MRSYPQPVMIELKAYFDEQAKLFEPNSVPAAAINYSLKRWTELTQFLRHVDTPLDNNITERALKLIIQSRKSSMFYKTLRSAEIAGYIQTALYTAAQNDINPRDYMLAVLLNKSLVMQSPEKWLPWNYHLELALLEEGKARHADASLTACP